MLEEFLEFINKNQLCTITNKILVGVSGGKDSMALLQLFWEAKFNISAAHYNFGLRGQASDGDEEFVRQFCEEKNIPFFSTKTDTKQVTKDWGVSTQMAARKLRYTWFKEIMAENEFDLLATAHNLDDRIETLYLNITKGTGPKGLKSIPLKKDKIIRPLLFASVTKIMKYLAENNLIWREDASNQTTDYQRNKIRHHVIPVLKEINPGIENTVQNNFQRFTALNEIFEEKLRAFEQTIDFGEFIKIPSERWKNSAGFSLVLEEFLKPYGFNFQDVEDLLKIDLTGKKITSASHSLTVGRGEWFLEKNVEVTSEIFEFQAPGVYEISNRKIQIQETKDFPSIMDIRKSEQAFFDSDLIEWPLTLRLWQQGDKFQPYGMNGKKLVSDFLIDSKINPTNKKNQLVLTDKKRIMWVVGLRTDDAYKLHSATKSILKVSFLDI
ncbi:MAG TPA: tRNA lysidine(34) synthetase TilS [Leadbetterella sp.]|nr:tRNA lysidine(34) synthetase TilS [Leadbetterella sp.]